MMNHKTIQFVLMLSALSLSARAIAEQNSSSPSQGSPAAGQTPNAEITIHGCVSGGERYTFMQESTRAIFALIGDDDRFAAAQGKLVEITANEFAPQGKSNELPKLQVKNLRVIADKCPIQSEKASPMPKPTSTNRGQTPATEEVPATAPYATPGNENRNPPNVNDPNISGDTGAPSPGTANPPTPPQSTPPE
jgi:hypothetical protein